MHKFIFPTKDSWIYELSSSVNYGGDETGLDFIHYLHNTNQINDMMLLELKRLNEQGLLVKKN